MLNLHGPPAKGKLASSKVNFYFKRGDNDNLRDDGGHLGNFITD